MPFTKAFNAVSFIDHCIRTGSARKVNDIANRLEISDRQVFNYFREMKNMGTPIAYCRKACKFYYTEQGSFFIGFLKEKSFDNNYTLKH